MIFLSIIWPVFVITVVGIISLGVILISDIRWINKKRKSPPIFFRRGKICCRIGLWVIVLVLYSTLKTLMVIESGETLEVVIRLWISSIFMAEVVFLPISVLVIWDLWRIWEE